MNKYKELIDHQQGTRWKCKVKYKVPKFYNNYGKNTLPVVVPSILNTIPTDILGTSDNERRKKMFKKFVIENGLKQY